MKLIEALKAIKDQKRKLDDLQNKIATFCADMDAEIPAYKTVEEQTKQIAEWLQAHHDIVKDIETLRLRIQKTNLATMVPIQITEKTLVNKSIAAWIHRRKDLSQLERAAWLSLTNKRLMPAAIHKNPKDPSSEVERIVQVRKYFDQKERDIMVEEYSAEPSKIDAALEIANATTDLLEL